MNRYLNAVMAWHIVLNADYGTEFRFWNVAWNLANKEKREAYAALMEIAFPGHAARMAAIFPEFYSA